MPGIRQRLMTLRGSASAIAIAVAAFGIVAGVKLDELAAGPEGEKLCPSLLQGSAEGNRDLATIARVATVDDLSWAQRGGAIDDVSCLNRVDVFGIVAVRSVEDIVRTLAYARVRGLKVTAAGVRHSMGGHAFVRGGIVLDMRKFNRMALDPATRTLTVESGATWHDIQEFMHPKFAVKSMQSTDIFTVGGSISVNAHGMDHQAGAISRSIRSLRVLLADGSIEEIAPDRNPELFRLVVGGYGLFGIILEARLEVVDNAVYQTGRRIIDYREFPDVFAREIEGNDAVALMYAHLSTARGSLLRETLIYSYQRVDGEGAEIPKLGEVGSTALRRLTFNLSKWGGVFMDFKWFAEKVFEPRLEHCTVSRPAAMASGEACLVSRNDPMHDSVAYLRNNLKRETDILHEYFVPRDQLIPFIDGLREIVIRNDANLLNASIRVVHEEDNFLSYAPRKAFSVVLYLNQSADAEGNRRMAKLTGELIDFTASLGGRFFLPYQTHYTAAQLKRSYPEIGDFFAAKRKYDPEGLFTNSFHRKYADAVSKI